jgi:hypothetical protein
VTGKTLGILMEIIAIKGLVSPSNRAIMKEKK